MHTVNRFESNLLKILYGILERAPAAQTLPLILRAFSDGKPKCLSRTCVDLVQDALRKGCVSLLTKWGGWQNESFLRNGAESKGRVWERTLPEDLGLSFSAATLDLLIWLTAAETGDSNANWTRSAYLSKPSVTERASSQNAPIGRASLGSVKLSAATGFNITES